jgi:hypothetical protein
VTSDWLHRTSSSLFVLSNYQTTKLSHYHTNSITLYLLHKDLSSPRLETPLSKPRLRFIDLARSIAVIMMLEGHCTGMALDKAYRSTEYPLYNFWFFIHNTTSPLFFTISGLVFAYLLTGKSTEAFFQMKRVRKGFKRVVELLVWGYLLQLDLRGVYNHVFNNVPYDMSWFAAFHVLQSIAVGIFGLLVIYGIHKWIGRIALHWYYLVGAMFFFYLNAWLNHTIMHDQAMIAQGIQSTKSFYPTDVPLFIQNMFYGPFSEFSVIRYLEFTLVGGMLGSIIRKNESRIFSFRFILQFGGAGVLILLFIQPVLRYLDIFLNQWKLANAAVHQSNTLAIEVIGMIIIFVSLLMIADKYKLIKDNLFLRIGQNTLLIYIAHVIILYGGIFGFGLYPKVLNQSMAPLPSVLFTVGFITFFIALVWAVEKREASK